MIDIMNNEKEILSLYTGKTECRPHFEQPFEQGDFVYATNDRSMIRISKCIISDCYDIHNIPNCKNLFNIKDLDEHIINIEELSKLLSSVELIPEVVESESRVKCKECGGYGVVDWEYGTFTKEMACPCCDGEGYVNCGKKETTGKMIRDPKCILAIHERSFKLEQIEKLVKTMELMNVQKVKMLIQRDFIFNAVLFNFSINIDVLLMPAYNNN